MTAYQRKEEEREGRREQNKRDIEKRMKGAKREKEGDI